MHDCIAVFEQAQAGMTQRFGEEIQADCCAEKPSAVYVMSMQPRDDNRQYLTNLECFPNSMSWNLGKIN